MRFLRIVAMAMAMAFVAGACSTPESQPSRTSTVTTTSTMPSHQPGVITGPAGTLRAAVAEPSTRADSAVRSLRVENLTGKAMVERSYRESPAELSEPLPAGRYRLISWTRECGGPCGGVPDDKLGPPTRICGTKVDVPADVVVTVTVSAPVDADCSMSTAS